MSLASIPSLDWKVEQLKSFLRDRGVTSSGLKDDLFRRVIEIHRQTVIDNEIRESTPKFPISDTNCSFEALPKSGWGSTGFPEISLPVVRKYLDSLVRNF